MEEERTDFELLFGEANWALPFCALKIISSRVLRFTFSMSWQWRPLQLGVQPKNSRNGENFHTGFFGRGIPAGVFVATALLFDDIQVLRASW